MIDVSKGEVKFNQAAYQQERLNDLMRVISVCWISPTKFNYSFGDYNYRVIFQTLTSYYAEIRVKMKNERGDLDKLRKDLDAYIENNPIIVSTKKSSLFNDTNGNTKFNQEAWNIIKECLFIYQNQILDAAESKGFGNPTKKDPSKAAVDL